LPAHFDGVKLCLNAFLERPLTIASRRAQIRSYCGRLGSPSAVRLGLCGDFDHFRFARMLQHDLLPVAPPSNERHAKR
jgi:hypothetical protein